MLSKNLNPHELTLDFDGQKPWVKNIILILIWFPVLFSSFLPGNTEIFPWGLLLILFLKLRNIFHLYLFVALSFFYTLLININFTLFEYIRSIFPLVNIFIIYFFLKEIDFKKNKEQIKFALKFVISLNYLIFFLELLNLDSFTYFFIPTREDEPGFINFIYNNRFNFFESEPSRASMQFFAIGVVSRLIFRENKFLIINFLIDIIFIRSLSGVATWLLFFLFLNKRYFIYLFFITLLSNIVLNFDFRITILQDYFFNFDFKMLFEKIAFFTGHRIPSILMAIGLIAENPLGFGFVSSNIYLQEHYLQNQVLFNNYLELTQMRPLFFNGKATLVSPFINVIFSLGVASIFVLYFIFKELLSNIYLKDKFLKTIFLTMLFLSIFLFDKGVIYPWIVFAYVNNRHLNNQII